MAKIITRLSGRLGNNLFQISTAYSLAKKYNRKLVVFSDNKEYFNSIFKDLDHTNIINFTHGSFTEPNNLFAKCIKININNNNTVIYGYFQNEKYFIDCRDELIKLFTDNAIYKSIDNIYTNSYFIHVRRGDYINNSYHYINLDNYYKKAINYIESKTQNPHFYIISDDIEYCKKYTIFDNINKSFVNNNTIETLYILSMCSLGGICGNSTFAWWGAWLNTNNNKIVIFPNKWLNCGPETDTSDIYFKGSVVIDIT